MSDDFGGSETVFSRGDGGVASPVAGLAAGTVVGGYAVESPAGAGGMGVVYRAHDTELGRAVALKLIGGGEGDALLRELFIRESLAAASIEHPNVLPVYRAGDDDGRLFIAMRFVDGASLQELIAASPEGIPPGRAARIVARVADALDAAHAKGLVHRDVKPGNVLIADPEGEEHVYLSDFGLTVHGTGAAASGGGSGWTGTLAYLAPEQARGEAVDARTDVYALGCVLFHALTGRTPFPTDDEQAALDAHIRGRVPAPSELVPGIPPALDEVVRRAMAKDPADRFPTAGELGRAALAARYDVALLSSPAESAAAEVLAAGLRESDVLPLVAVGSEPRAAESVRAAEACAVLVGHDGLGDWARDGLAAAHRVAARDRAFRLVLVLLPGAPPPGDPALAFMADHPWVDLRAGAGDALAATDLVRALRGADVPAGLPQAEGVAPYRGLEAFREEDASLYFGREHDVARVIEQLRTGRFVAVLGPSGSGKSSLVHAGLVPALQRDAAAGTGDWRVLEMLPGHRPLAALAAQLAHLPGAGAPSAADLAADERTLDVAVAAALGARPAGERVLLVVDQLEEAFTLCADEGERAAFLGNLVYAATIPAGRTVVVGTMRADFYHRLAEHPEMRGLVATRQVLLGPLDARGLRRAIEEPARRCNLELEPGLTRRILTDVADRPGTLPLLEYLLLEVWRRRRDHTLTLEGYAASGGVEGALARRANEVYGAMDPGHQAIARRVLLRLTQPGEGTEDTRRRAERRELVTDPAEQADVDAVVDSLAEARLVTTGVDPASGEPVVEVTHEALIRGWPELRGWIDEDRDRLRAERRLSDAAAEWDRGGRDEGGLYRGARLLAWQERDTSDLNPLERDYLGASRERDERDRAARRRRTRLVIGGLGAALAVIAAVAVFAFVQRGDANDQRDLALSRQVAASASDRLPADPEQSLLLAEQAYRIAPTTQAESALRRATSASLVRFAYDGHQGAVRSLASLPGAYLVASAGDDGTVQLWDPTRPDATLRVLRGHDGPVLAVALSSDGRTVVSGGEDGTVRVWRAKDGAPERTLTGGGGPVRGVAVSADGQIIAAGGDGGTVRVWRSGGGSAPSVMKGRMPTVTGVALSADGATVAASGGERPIGLGITSAWTSADGQLIRNDDDYTGYATGVALSPDGSALYGVSFDNTVRRYPLPSGKGAEVVDALGDQLTSIAVADDAIATGAIDGSAIVWSPDGTRIATLPGHRGSVTSVAFVKAGAIDATVLSGGEDGLVRGSSWTANTPARFTGEVATGRFDGANVEYLDYSAAVFDWTGPGNATRPVAPSPNTAAASVNWMALSPRGDIARSFTDDTITYTRADGREMTPIRGVGADVYQLALSPNGTRLVVSNAAGEIFAWDVSGTDAQPIVTGKADLNANVAVADDGAVAARIGHTVRLWLPGQEPRTFTAGDQEVRALAFSPDGTQLAVGATDGTVTIWPVSGGPSTVLLRNPGGVQGLTFSADGRLLAVAATDTALVWDWARDVAAAEWDEPGVIRTAFDAAAHRVLTVTQTGMNVRACDVCGPIADVEQIARGHVTRSLTDAERREFAPGS